MFCVTDDPVYKLYRSIPFLGHTVEFFIVFGSTVCHLVPKEKSAVQQMCSKGDEIYVLR